MPYSNDYSAKVAATLVGGCSQTKYSQRLRYFIGKIQRDSDFEQIIPDVTTHLFEYAENPTGSKQAEYQFRAIHAIQKMSNVLTSDTQNKIREMCQQSWEIGQKNPYVRTISKPAKFLGINNSSQ
jgi:hypothetical protein